MNNNMSIEELKQLQSKIIAKSKKCNKIKVTIMIVILAALVIAITKILSKGFNFEKLIISFMISIFVLCFGFIITLIIEAIIINAKDIEEFSRAYKKIFVIEKLKNTFEDLSYKAEGIDEEILEKTKMIRTADSFESNDYISGKYKNIKFEQSDICIKEAHETEDKDGNTETTWITIFEGQWITFDFHKKFKSSIQIVSSNFCAENIPWKVEKVETEDLEFNKQFNIYAKDPHDVFYILTPHFMEKIKNIYKELNCNIMFCFLNNKLYIAIDNSEDSFEVNPYEEIDEEKIKNSISKDIELITDFVNDLDLDDNIFNIN